LTSSSVDVKVLDCSDGSVQLANATTLEISTPSDLLKAMNDAKGRRATEATDKNGASSRSHAVCQLQMKVWLTADFLYTNTLFICYISFFVCCTGKKKRRADFDRLCGQRAPS
jgi:hypothetical protein